MALRFTHLCELFAELEALDRRRTPATAQEHRVKCRRAVYQWFTKYRCLIDAPCTSLVALLSSLLPAWRTDRVYGMRQTRVSSMLGYALGLPADQMRRLREIADTAEYAEAVRKVVAERCPAASSAASVDEVDHAFGQLAALCRFSSPAIRRTSKPDNPLEQRRVLRPILTKLSASELKWFMRLLFKNLSFMEPLQHVVLLNINPWLPAVLKIHSDFTTALETLESSDLQSYDVAEAESIPPSLLNGCLRPKLGSKIGRPQFLKVRSINHCINLAQGGCWSVEPKFDGEYCQIHIDRTKAANQIQIFSKSGKDSTRDRLALQPWLRTALKLDTFLTFQRYCILEGEMVVVDSRTDEILPFHKIRKHVSRSGIYIGTEQDSVDEPYEQLRVIFYDLLLLDDDVVMHKPLDRRKGLLREILDLKHCRQQLAPWGKIDMSEYATRPKKIQERLENVFKKAMARRCEGLVLKPADRPYLSLLPSESESQAGAFLKFKADYIAGLGDTADFVVVGALRKDAVGLPAGTSLKWTHLVLACLQNKSEMTLTNCQPVYRAMDLVSRPAISSDDLVFINQQGSYRERPFIPDDDEVANVDYRLDVTNQQTRPEVLFREPFIVEVLGSAFERPQSTNFWMLRFPRIKKVHTDDRTFRDIVSFDELQQLAEKAMTVPQDLQREEAECLSRLQEASRPKRLPEYIIDNSYNSERTEATPMIQQSTIPETIESADADASGSRKTASNDDQPAGTKAGPESSRQTNASTLRDELAPSQPPRLHLTRTATEGSLIPPPRKRRAQVGRQFASSQPQPQHQDLVHEPQQSNNCHDAPLTEISNNALTRSQPSSVSTNEPSKTPKSQAQQLMVLSSSPAPEIVLHHPVEDVYKPREDHPAIGLPRELLHHSPFKAPGLSFHSHKSISSTLVDEYLLPLFTEPANAVSSVQAWSEDQTDLADIIHAKENESESFADKYVFVDRRCARETRVAAAELLRVRMRPGDKIFLLDVGILSHLGHIDQVRNYDTDKAALIRTLGSFLVATVCPVLASGHQPSKGFRLRHLQAMARPLKVQDFVPPKCSELALAHLDVLDLPVVTCRYSHRMHGAPTDISEIVTANLILRGGFFNHELGKVLAERWMS